jgi:hypothetical protein
MLLAASGGSDSVDAAIVGLAADGDDILTSDPVDLGALAEAAGSPRRNHRGLSRKSPDNHIALAPANRARTTLIVCREPS